MSGLITLRCDATDKAREMGTGSSCSACLEVAATSLLAARDDAALRGWTVRRSAPEQTKWTDLCPRHSTRKKGRP